MTKKEFGSHLAQNGFLYSLLAVGVNLGQFNDSGSQLCNLQNKGTGTHFMPWYEHLGKEHAL